MPGCGWGWGWAGMGVVGWLVMLLVWAGLLALIAWAVTRLVLDRGGRDRGQHHGETPEEILDRRFASGEIDAAAYEEARARLAGQRGKPR